MALRRAVFRRLESPGDRAGLSPSTRGGAWVIATGTDEPVGETFGVQDRPRAAIDNARTIVSLSDFIKTEYRGQTLPG